MATNDEAAGAGQSDTGARPLTERHASWIELFFDLVVVAGVGQLAHLLHEDPSLADTGLYLLLYLAFWTAWACFTVYGNVQGDRVRALSMLLAMFGLAVMVAAVPGVHEDEHVTAFVIAYVFLRWLAGRVWRRGQVVVDWPLAQFGAGALPWLISLWVPEPGRYWLWAAGIALDLGIMLGVDSDRMLRGARDKLDQAIAHRGGRPQDKRRHPESEPPVIAAAPSESGHLAERLGLFVIIVLGEGVIQITTAASDTHWDGALAVTATGSFALLIGVWTLSLLYGFAGVPHLSPDKLSVRSAMLLHCVTTAAIAALAAGLGAAAEHVHGPAPDGVRRLLCLSVAAYFGISLLTGLVTRAERPWLLGWGLPCVLAPLALGLFGAGIGVGWLVWVLAATVFWQVLYAPGPPGTTLAPGGRGARRKRFRRSWDD
ncbi:low temperature requirement protein A [Streptomyces sp. NPDC057302]|uniref:low temperature requirement protein A n=1 Tax=Streptomyces sp. NPDC057302 TaxID=3346094 RepID=UPI0036300E3C